MVDVRVVAAMAIAGVTTDLGRRYLSAKFDDPSQSAAVAAEFAALVARPDVPPGLIVPVPSSTPIAAAFAAELGRRWDVPVLGALRWTRPVPPLKHVPVADRPALIDAAFDAERVNASVLVVDDVVRSGATLGEAARALRAAGAAHVACLAMLRVE